jgi:hypothetical protein
MKGNSKPSRIDPSLEKSMREVAKIRLQKGLADLKPKEVSVREMTRLLTRTEGFQLSLNELKTKPKRK